MSFARWMFAAALALSLTAAPAFVAHADTSITSSNQSKDSETNTGDAESSNSSSAFVGHSSSGTPDEGAEADINAATGSNIQEGDNDFNAKQRATSTSGSSVGGQVVAGVSEGDVTIDATNLTDSVDSQTGDAAAENSSAAFVGLAFGTSTDVGPADLELAGGAINAQEGDNSGDLDQTQVATSGDAITGQIVAGVTSAGGATDIASANTTRDSSSTSGDTDEEGSSALFVGLSVASETTVG